MFDLDQLKADGEKYREMLGDLLEVELTPELANRLYWAAMGKERSELYRVALFYGQEADRCRSAGAYFVCCLMYASAIEALLAVLCLTCRKEIEPSDAFKKFRKGKGYEEKVLSADFHNYIEIASNLDWIPSDVVSADLLTAAVQDFPLVLANLYPLLTPEGENAKVDSFRSNPGLEMLRFLQDMRNLIHGARWPRLGITISTGDFESDCKFVMVIANQVLFCLFATFSNLAVRGMAQADEMKAKLSPQEFSLVIKQLQEMAGNSPPASKDQKN